MCELSQLCSHAPCSFELASPGILITCSIALLTKAAEERKEGFALAHRFKGYSPSRLKKQETSGHTGSVLRDQIVMDACAQLTFSFVFTQESQPMEWHCPHLGWVLPFQLTQSRKFFTGINKPPHSNSQFPQTCNEKKKCIQFNFKSTHRLSQSQHHLKVQSLFWDSWWSLYCNLL